MTTEHHDFWADLPEWENRYDPGQILDSWREAEELFAPLAKLAECSGNEALETAVYSAENRVAAQVRRWEEEVRGLLKENMREGRLTPFGEALSPLLRRAGISPYALLAKAGRLEEHAHETPLAPHARTVPGG